MLKQQQSAWDAQLGELCWVQTCAHACYIYSSSQPPQWGQLYGTGGLRRVCGYDRLVCWALAACTCAVQTPMEPSCKLCAGCWMRREGGGWMDARGSEAHAAAAK